MTDTQTLTPWQRMKGRWIHALVTGTMIVLFFMTTLAAAYVGDFLAAVYSVCVFFYACLESLEYFPEFDGRELTVLKFQVLTIAAAGSAALADGHWILAGAFVSVALYMWFAQRNAVISYTTREGIPTNPDGTIGRMP